MNRLPAILAALVTLSVALSGCTLGLDDDERQSTDDGDDAGEARRLAVDVPEGATQLRVHVDAQARSGEPDVTILVEDAAGANLATDTFSVRGGTTRTLSADVHGQDILYVTVRVVEGAASLDVRVSAVVPGQPDVIVVRETLVITVQPTPTPTPTATTPAPTASTPPPTATTPATTPPTATTPPPTNATANATNATG